MNTEPRLYDMSFWIKDDKSGNAPDSFFDKMKGVVSRHGGTLVRDRRLEKRDLAYLIKKQSSAWWAEMQFTMEPGRLTEFKDALKYEDDIVRKAITAVVLKKRIEKPRKPMAARMQKTGEGQTKESIGKESDVDLDAKLKQILET